MSRRCEQTKGGDLEEMSGSCSAPQSSSPSCDFRLSMNKPSFLSASHREQLEEELPRTSSSGAHRGGHVSKSRDNNNKGDHDDSRSTSVAPSLLPSRRPSLSDLNDHELFPSTEATERPVANSSSAFPRNSPLRASSHLSSGSTSFSAVPPDVQDQHQQQHQRSDPKKPSLVCISGGSAGNSIVEAFTRLSSEILFILPVSDNGGSSSEIIRVLGGPSIGDLRSRLIRLIPDHDPMKQLLAYRLPSDATSPQAVRAEWHTFVEGQHALWSGLPTDRREVLRSFLVHFEAQILARAHRRFNFSGGSIGNFFLWGCLSFFRNLESAIYLFSTLTGISNNHVVCPCINTNSIVTIAAELEVRRLSRASVVKARLIWVSRVS